MTKIDRPPFTITPRILARVADIAAATERVGAQASRMNPQLRRGNRIRTIQASLAIEQNSLTLEQMTAVLEGKRVLGTPAEIQEVRNAFSAYEALDTWDPTASKDLLAAHGILIQGLVDRAGKYRAGGVGITQGQKVVHMAPLAGRVTALVRNLQSWLATTDQVTDQVESLLKALGGKELGAAELMTRLTLSHRPTFRQSYLHPAMEAGLVERTDPGSPSSPRQKYRLTEAGKRITASHRKKVDE